MSLKSKYGMFKGTTAETLEANDPENKKKDKHTYLDSSVVLYKPPVDKKEDSRVRFIGNPENNYIFVESKVHFSIGDRFESSICPKWAAQSGFELENANSHCPLCEKAKVLYDKAREHANVTDEDKKIVAAIKKEAKDFAAQTYNLAYIVDRAEPDKGVQVWAIYGTRTPDAIRLLMKDRESPGGVINIEDLEEGYDVFFNKKSDVGGTGFPGVTAIARANKTSPLSANMEEGDAWLDFVLAHPTSKMLKVMSVADIERKVFGGSDHSDSDSDDDDSDSTDSEDDAVPVSNLKVVSEKKADAAPAAKPAGAESATDRLKRLKEAQLERKASAS